MINKRKRKNTDYVSFKRVRTTFYCKKENINMASGIYPNPNDTKAPPPYEFSNAPNSGPQYPHPNPVYSPNFGTLRIFE
jgi:hypothetical protein